MKIYTERLNQIYTQSGIRSIRQFAEAAGLVCGTLTDTLHNGTEPRYTLLRSILNSNPNVSAEWLMRGEGSMYKNQTQSVSNSNSTDSSENAVANSGRKELFVKIIQEQLAKKDEQISNLSEQLRNKEELINKLFQLL